MDEIGSCSDSVKTPSVALRTRSTLFPKVLMRPIIPDAKVRICRRQRVRRCGPTGSSESSDDLAPLWRAMLCENFLYFVNVPAPPARSRLRGGAGAPSSPGQ